MTKIYDLKAAFSHFHAGMQADGYSVTLRDPTSASGFNISKRAGLPDVITPGDVIDILLRFGFSALAQGWSPIARPRSASRTIFQLDDLQPGAIESMIEHGWRPCYTQQTSPGKCQAALAVDHVDDVIRLEVRRRLIAIFRADPGATGAYRLPGFQNAKPKYRADDGSYPRVTPLSWSGETCLKTALLVEQVMAEIAEKAAVSVRHVDLDPDDIATLDDLAAAWQRLEHHAYRAYGPLWKSEHDWLMAVMLRYFGAVEDEVREALTYLSPRHSFRSKNEGGFERAAAITADRAFGDAGDEALESLVNFRWLWERDFHDEKGAA
ncbi:DNA-primase RepB domain-containing protein [Acidocella sp. C78]|uniref:DNA-primase RepB domain-containing protein n=1 Tax=Acidocella sp. C78 TaxID=1671486 RepID=UPI00191B93FD|nr:DNA-primase RepB domain-containing protein [Acidocella sp. C78]